MREEDSNWFSKWEEQLPSQEELMPLSQTLITPDLASAFDIPRPRSGGTTPISLFNHLQSYGVQLHQQCSSTLQPPPTQHNSSEFDSSSVELGCVGGGGSGGGVVSGSEELARTLKRPRLVWTPQLHKRFVDAVAHLGIKNAVPKTIVQLMSVDGLTRENVASHLQKYRLYLKRMQGINNGGGNGPGGSGDPITDHLFASSPIPAHFLHQTAGVGGGGGFATGARTNSDHYMSYMPATALNRQQLVVGHHQIQGQYNHHHRQVGHFGSAQGQASGPFDHPFLSRQAQSSPINRNGVLQGSSGFVEALESGTVNNGRKVLTLFPTVD